MRKLNRRKSAAAEEKEESGGKKGKKRENSRGRTEPAKKVSKSASRRGEDASQDSARNPPNPSERKKKKTRPVKTMRVKNKANAEKEKPALVASKVKRTTQKKKKVKVEEKEEEKVIINEVKKKRKKTKKSVLAKRKLERMKRRGFLTPPPRRSAALNASAIMNCMLDTATASQVKIKTEPQEAEPETESAPVSDSQSKVENPAKSVNQTKPGINKVVKRKSVKKSCPPSRDRDDSDLDKSPRSELKPTRGIGKRTKLRKKKKSAKSSLFKGDMKDLIVGRRMASLNASAMMTATYGQKWKRKDPLKMAIEASLREAEAKGLDIKQEAEVEPEEEDDHEEIECEKLSTSKDSLVAFTDKKSGDKAAKPEKQSRKVEKVGPNPIKQSGKLDRVGANLGKPEKTALGSDKTDKLNVIHKKQLGNIVSTATTSEQSRKLPENLAKNLVKSSEPISSEAKTERLDTTVFSEENSDSLSREREMRMKLIENAMMKNIRSKPSHKKHLEGKKLSKHQGGLKLSQLQGGTKPSQQAKLSKKCDEVKVISERKKKKSDIVVDKSELVKSKSKDNADKSDSHVKSAKVKQTVLRKSLSSGFEKPSTEKILSSKSLEDVTKGSRSGSLQAEVTIGGQFRKRGDSGQPEVTVGGQPRKKVDPGQPEVTIGGQSRKRGTSGQPEDVVGGQSRKQGDSGQPEVAIGGQARRRGESSQHEAEVAPGPSRIQGSSLHHQQNSQGFSGGQGAAESGFGAGFPGTPSSATPPTATVPPTMVPVRQMPAAASQVKPLVGTISPVKYTESQGYSYSTSCCSAQYTASYSSGTVLTQSTVSLPSTVYSSGYVQSTMPTTVYSGGYVQTIPPTHSNQFYSGQGYSGGGGSPYSYNYPNYTFQGYQGKQGGNPSHQDQMYHNTFQGGYYITAPTGNLSFSVVPVTTGADTGKGDVKCVNASPSNTGVIYGHYNTCNYPSRVIGPIIALAPGGIPVASTSSSTDPSTNKLSGQLPAVKPVLRQSLDGSSKPQGKAAPIMAAVSTLPGYQLTSATASKAVTTLSGTASMFRAACTQPTDSAVYRAAAVQQYRNSAQQQQQQQQQLSGSTESSFNRQLSTDTSGYRQILPKDGSKSSSRDSSHVMGSPRPLQIVGPITGAVGSMPGGLVAAVLPQQLQQQQQLQQPQQNLMCGKPSLPTAMSISSPVMQKSAMPTSNCGGSIYSNLVPTQQLSGLPQQLSGQTPQLSGQPKQLSGQPQQFIGKAQQLSGQPQQLRGQPQQLSGQPRQLSGQPQQLRMSHIHSQQPPVSLSSKPQTQHKPTVPMAAKPAVLTPPAKVSLTPSATNLGGGIAREAKKKRSGDPPAGQLQRNLSNQTDLSVISNSVSIEVVKPSNPPDRLSKPNQQASQRNSPANLASSKKPWYWGSQTTVPSSSSSTVSSTLTSVDFSKAKMAGGVRPTKPVTQADEVKQDSQKSGFGHPGLPNGLLLASSVVQTSKSPTKVSSKEVKPIKRHVPVPYLLSPERCPKQRKIYEEPPVLSPQVPVKNRHQSRISHTMAKTAANAVKSPEVVAGAKPAIKEVPKTPLVASNMGRSRLQLKPATSPKLMDENYPTVQRVKINIDKKLSKSNSSSSIGSITADKGRRSNSLEKSEKKKRDASGGKRGALAPTALVPWRKRSKDPPLNSGGWSWVGDGAVARVYLHNEDSPVERITYQRMRHEEGDEEVKVKDCILLASGTRRKDLPFIAKVTALWENPDDGEMMMSLLWYYRPEHTDGGRQPDDLPQEIFASKHRDHTSVACIEDKCYVMTFNEFCRYKKFCKMIEAGVTGAVAIVPELMSGKESGYPRANYLPTRQVPPDRIFLCRKVYDSRGKKLMKNPV